MTPRQRLMSAVRGGEVDRKPLICWPTPGENADINVAHASRLRSEKSETGSLNGNSLGSQNASGTHAPLCLAQIANPFGRAIAQGIDLNQTLKNDPTEGGKTLDRLSKETEQEIQEAFQNGADGIFYLLHGACEKHCTPMQYGGYYLERDREILERIEDSGFNVLFVVGDENPYLDFVSDLLAEAFAWDAPASGISVAEVRKMRPGALAADDSDADILLKSGVKSIAQMVEGDEIHSTT